MRIEIILDVPDETIHRELKRLNMPLDDYVKTAGKFLREIDYATKTPAHLAGMTVSVNFKPSQP